MTDFAGFKHGNTEFPLSITDGYSLLRTADPSLYYALEFYASILNTHLGARLAQAATAAGATQITSAVAETLPLNPEPFLTEEHIRFPLLSLYRKGTTYRFIGQRRISVSSFELAYVLPPMKASEAERILPILHAAEAIIDNRTSQGFDPAYTPTAPTGTAGEVVWSATRAGLVRVDIQASQTGAYTPTQDLFFPAVIISMTMEERSEALITELQDFGGGDVSVDLQDNGDDTTVADVVQIADYQVPQLISVSPATGDISGGDSVTITGKGFEMGTTPIVLFGGSTAASVLVVSATSVTCQTPAHALGAVDVQLLTEDGLYSNVLSGAFTFAP